MIAQWILYALLSAVFAALVAILGKKGLAHLDSTYATTIRAVVMAGFLILVSLLLGKFRHSENLKMSAFFFIAASGIAGALSWLCYFLAIQTASSQQVPAVAAIDRLSLIFVLIFGILFLGNKLTMAAIIGALLVTSGVILLSL